MVLLSMVWGMASVTTKEIVPPSNKPKTVSPFRLLSFSFFTLNNQRVKLSIAAGRVHCFLRAPEEFPQHHLVTGPSGSLASAVTHLSQDPEGVRKKDSELSKNEASF